MIGTAYLLPSGQIAYPVTVADKKIHGVAFDIAEPGTPEHKKWKPFAQTPPEGLFTRRSGK